MARTQSKPTAPDARPLLDNVLQATHEALAAAQRARNAALEDVLSDPEAATLRVQELDAKIAAAQARTRTLNDAIEQRDQQARIAEQARLREATKAERAQIIKLSELSSQQHAPAFDTALTAVLDAATRYRDCGNARAAFTERAVNDLHVDINRAHDALILALPRAYGYSNADTAVVIAHFIRRLLAILNNTRLNDMVEVGQYLPQTPRTISEAARLDAAWLQQQFGGTK